jgi:hypothetical protein
MQYEVTQLFIHYKGGRYLQIGIAETHHHRGEYDVVYISLTYGKMVTRPLHRDSRNEDSWTDEVLWPDGMARARFMPASMLGAYTIQTCFPNDPPRTR